MAGVLATLKGALHVYKNKCIWPYEFEKHDDIVNRQEESIEKLVLIMF